MNESQQQQPEPSRLPASAQPQRGVSSPLATAAPPAPAPVDGRDLLSLVHRDPYMGASSQAFPEEIQQILHEPVHVDIVEITPDGRVYVPAVQFRKKLTQAFGSGGWALIPRGGWAMNDGALSREYALFVKGRFVSEARGEQDYIPDNRNTSEATATEGVHSNAITRCCKDLCIYSELWDRSWTREWKKNHAQRVWCVNQKTGEKKQFWRRADDVDAINWPWREDNGQDGGGRGGGARAGGGGGGGGGQQTQRQRPPAQQTQSQAPPHQQQQQQAPPPQQSAPAAQPAASRPVPPAGQASPARPAAQRPAAPAQRQAAQPPIQGQGGAAQQTDIGAMRQRFWAVLKLASGSQDDAVGRRLLMAICGTDRGSNLDERTMTALGPLLNGVFKKVNRIENGSIVDNVTGDVLWQRPGQAAAPAAPAAPPPPQQPAAPPPVDDGAPPVSPEVGF